MINDEKGTCASFGPAMPTPRTHTLRIIVLEFEIQDPVILTHETIIH